MGVGNDGVFGIDGAMVQIEESLWFTFAYHVAALGIGTTDLDFLVVV
jgi:hypothetical protein